MNNILKLTVLFIFLIGGNNNTINAQNTTDSLENIVNTEQNDSAKNIALEQLYKIYVKNNWGMAINTAKRGISLSQRKDSSELVNWYTKLGNIYFEQGLYTLSLNAYSKALKNANNINMNSGDILSNIAKIYSLQKKYDKSIALYRDALKEFKKFELTDEKKSKSGIAKTYNKLGIVYEAQNKPDSAKIYYRKALNLRIVINNQKEIADSYTSLGYFSNYINEYDSAIHYFTKGINVCLENNEYYYFNDLHLFRSSSYLNLGMFEKAYHDIDTAKQYAEQYDKTDLARVYYFYAQTDFAEKNYARLLKNTDRSLQYADSFNLIPIKNNILQLLVNAALLNKDFKKAFESQLLLSENLKSDKSETITQLEKAVDLEIQKKQNYELSEINKGLEKNITLFQILILVGIVIFIFLIVFIILNRQKNKKVKKALLQAEEQKNIAEKAKKELENSTEQIRAQAALADILGNVTGKERSLKEFLQDALNKLLNLPWLNIVSKGSIFITNKDGNLEMLAEKDLGILTEKCAVIKPGQCLCGKTLSEKKMQFSDHIDHNHEIKTEEMTEHGHYNIPIMMNGKVLGVLNLYTKHRHEKKDSEVKFLKTVSDTLASVINRKKSQNEILHAKTELEEKNSAINKYLKQIEDQSKEKEKMNRKLMVQKSETEKYLKQIEDQKNNQEALNQQLFAQKLEVEQRNSEIQQYSKQLEEKAKEQESLNQQLFAQKLEVEQRNSEIQQYSKQLEEKSKEQEALNQRLFAQKMEIEEQKNEQDKLNQKLFAQSLEVDQRSLEIKMYSKQIETLKEKAENALNYLNASINYSKYIQNSLLPDDALMNEIFPSEFFVYYKPKEAIGGDFYFIQKVNDHIIFAVADCTGHGVPGALITMLGISFLNDFVQNKEINTPGEALNQLRKKIKLTFKSEGKTLENKNGLDIALCAVNTKTNILQYAGAFNPLIIIRNNELKEYKATRNPIGYYPVEKSFETQEIQLEKNDILYLFSDGYSDQVGGENNRKFSKRQMKDLLIEIHKFPMKKQNIFIEKIMQKWMGNNQQIDDITLMGIKWDN